MLPFFFVFLTFWRSLRHGLRDPEFRALFAVLLGTLGLGTYFYHQVEGWDWLDALYFCVITLATIGYGDITPKTPTGKAFTILFVFLGIGLLAAFFSKLAASIVVSEEAERPRLWRRKKPNAKPGPDDPPPSG
jgi:hypothetical protein